MENEKKISKISKQRTKKEKEFVTVGEASALTGLGPQTIRKMVDKQTLLSYRTPSNQRKINFRSLQ
jgi:excisionase family DNA binding protein